MRITAIGAANIDVTAKSKSEIVNGKYNLSDISLSAGGAALNIAAMLAVNSAKVDLIAAVGNDMLGKLLRDSCAGLGINIGTLISRNNTNTCIEVNALKNDGEHYISFGGEPSAELLRTGDITRHKEIIRETDLLIMDLNLPREILSAAIEHREGRPIMVDAVDVDKVSRVEGILSDISILKLNRVQAERLTGITLEAKERVKYACQSIVERGVERVFITLGMAGVCAADKKGAIVVPSIPVVTKDLSGVGAAFSAGIALNFKSELRQQAEQGAWLASKHLGRNMQSRNQSQKTNDSISEQGEDFLI